jgi:hypothetical protein
MISNMGQDKMKFDAKMRSVHALMKFMDVSDDLYLKVTNYYEFKFASKTMFDGAQIFAELPTKLRSDLTLHRYKEVIDKVPFFHGIREDATVEIADKLKSYSVMPFDYVMVQGEPYRELMILTTGKARSIPPGEAAAKLGPRAFSAKGADAVDAVIEFPEGSFFGELEFLGFSELRSMTVEAERFCEISTLHPADIESVLNIHIGLRRRLQRYGGLKKEMEAMMKEDQVSAVTMEEMKQKIEDGFEIAEDFEVQAIFKAADTK